jgi:hypothetical protein
MVRTTVSALWLGNTGKLLGGVPVTPV